MKKDPGDFFEWLASTLKRNRALAHYRNGLPINLGDLTANVPCGDCHKCCEHNVQTPESVGQRPSTTDYDAFCMLEQTDENDCVCAYLVDGKCKIYRRRSILCRTYDCRIHMASGFWAREMKDAIMQWGTGWFEYADQELILFAISLAAKDIKEMPRANSIIASDRGIARFGEYLGQASTARSKR